MENQQYQKVVQVSYILCSALVAFVLLMGMMKVASTYDLESRIKDIEYFIRGISVLIGAGVFFYLFKNAKVNEFMQEVAVELLSKVTWPTQKETSTATIVVIITVILAGLVLACFDWLWTMLLRWVI